MEADEEDWSRKKLIFIDLHLRPSLISVVESSPSGGASLFEV
jgi:hypothetical protein